MLPHEYRRYDRQLSLLGIKRQEKLKSGKVFIAGAGSLGSCISVYLTLAGVGKVRIADRDEVELSNLNRQFLHWDKDIGERKIYSAREKLSRMNPLVEIETCGEIKRENVFEQTKGFDLLIDALDNFSTRYLLNEASIFHGIPFIHGACEGWEGRVTTIVPGKTACLRCIFPEMEEKGSFPIIGVTAGVVATIQATEALKILTGEGNLLLNRLLLYNGRTMKFDEVALERIEKCPACGNVSRNSGKDS
jgi:adenylyltransferase/sulfurtransferase